MAVAYPVMPPLHPVAGVRIGIASAGIKRPGRRDITLFELVEGSQCAAVFTRNAFCAAPVVLAKASLAQAMPRYLLINTGNANAGTGSAGLNDAQRCCGALAALLDCGAEQVLPFSTGVIGEPLPVDKIIAALPAAHLDLQGDNWAAAAEAIMTTDTVTKGESVQLQLGGRSITLTGIAKGSGMIRPDMGTMLAYVATDAAIEAALLQRLLQQAVDASFNRITVDGDTSTNDACVLIATGQSGLSLAEGSEALPAFADALQALMGRLAQRIVRDGEGATKFIAITVEEGGNEAECAAVAYTIAHSPLVKTALFASDPNWGRILAAVGRAGLDGLDLEAVHIFLDEVCIVYNGGRASSYTEAQGQAVMAKDEIAIRVLLGRGQASTTVWTCDLSYDYVKINAEYRS
ncbi:MAG: bifunctional glutamate N-acetyltransferase/amino-acid acetyltransferase ArgJ [Gammaproteobacteria bacterium]|nr:bifunctional glutamate N-acetyltransferase/amino-acid acetyltransferase ArgJ [Gammaproteobacteria bacterium]